MKLDRSIVFPLLAALLIYFFRVIPHLGNLSPVLALCLLSGLASKGKPWSYFFVIGALALSDQSLLTHSGWAFTYLPLVGLVFMGHFMKNSLSSQMTWGIAGAAVFMLVSNFGVWLNSGLYAPTWEGLVTCYEMALPFFRASLVGTVGSLLIFRVFQELWIKNFKSLTASQKV